MPLTNHDVSALKALCGAKTSARRKRLVERGGARMQRLLRNTAYNILKGNVPTTRAQLRRLKRYKAGVRALAGKQLSPTRRRALTQKGGFLSALLAPLLTRVVGNAVTGLVGRITGIS